MKERIESVRNISINRRILLSIKLLIAFIFLTASLVHASGLTIGPSATMSINNATLTISNDILINGTLTESAGTINVGGNWTNNGTFIAGTGGTVKFIDGQSPVTISGNTIDTSFYNFNATTNSGKQISFDVNTSQTVVNDITLQGVAGNLLTLRSTVDSQQASINFLNPDPYAQHINYVDVKDHKATGQWLADGPPSDFNSIDSGNNYRWFLPSADLAIVKTASPDPVTVGQNFTYTITVTNNGPDTATGVTVTDILPAGVTHVSSTSSVGTCIGASAVTCSIGDLANGASATITITVIPIVVGQICNSASVSGTEDDPNQVNNTTNPPICITSTGSADLSITKTDSSDPVNAGTTLNYTITVTNNGPDTAFGAVMTDTLPSGVVFNSCTSTQGTCTDANGTVTADIGTISNGSSVTIIIAVTPTATGLITNSASVANNVTDPNLSNNSATEQTQVNSPSTDLAITNTDSPDPVPTAGQNVTYTITVTNNGPSIATDVTITDTPDTTVTILSAIPSQGSCIITAAITCNLGSLNSGASAVVTIVAATTVDGMIGNDACVTGTETDPNTANDCVSTTTNVGDVSRLTGISTRARVEEEALRKNMVGGFNIIDINGLPKKILVRGRGPSMSGPPYNFTDTLTNPILEIYYGPTLFAVIDDWQSGPTKCDAPAISCGTSDELINDKVDPCQPNSGQTVSPPGCNKEAAMYITLPPGQYTAKVKGVLTDDFGKGIAEIYDIDTTTLPRLTGISTRGLVLTDTNLMVGGFIISGGSSNKTVLIRGRGPSMSGAPYFFSGTLPDPLLEIYCGPTMFAQVDNWQDGPIQCDPPAISCSIPTPPYDPCQFNNGQETPPPGCMLEAALIITLPPLPACGGFTAKLKDANGETGIGIFEVYDLGP